MSVAPARDVLGRSSASSRSTRRTCALVSAEMLTLAPLFCFDALMALATAAARAFGCCIVYWSVRDRHVMFIFLPVGLGPRRSLKLRLMSTCTKEGSSYHLTANIS